ncbi:CDP-alcohol phosphatidyltransferase-like enzyme [Geodermatophilus normandii]|uniref:CDP-alcohol phosphatidyltransferase-like enzyme n=1 Tax=Geodermatophilus normandii TaxID=1137989 RepID=A0A317QGG5_9ACTN|nr:CDP-alcohol phosphatidyltransferase family protein [Geodermatophilus normandii]PWW21395.1 CDP-alcohol phosphatidyltransferase-like enzyme [Geodermatophilus normandii]
MLQDDVAVAEAPATPTRAPSRPAPGESLADTVRRLAGAQKGAHGAPAYSRFVNRPAGRVLAALAFHRGLTPDAVTATSAAFSFSAIATVALAPHTWWVGVLVALGLVLGYALDSADGQLARLRGGGTPAGEWLDHMVDAAKTVSIHLAVLVGLFRQGEVAAGWLLVPVVFVVSDVVYFSAMLLNEALRTAHGAPTRAAPRAGRASVLRSLLVLPTDYGALCLVFVLLGSAPAFLAGYGLLALCTAGFVLAALPRWRREMSRLGAA